MRRAAAAIGFGTVALLAGCSFDFPTGGNTGDPADARSGDSPNNVGDSGPLPPDACADGDHDTVCDVADKCPNGDDRVDGDADTIPDACDTWPCGAEPGSPSNTVLFPPSSGLIVSNLTSISFAGEGDQTSSVAAGTVARLDYDFGLLFSCGAQSSCREQIEFGFAGVGRIGCLVDSTQNDNVFLAALNRHTDLAVPATPGVYQLRVKSAFNQSGCGTSTDFTNGEPGGSNTVAIVCVPP
jgi:hypothetical protein